MPLPKMSFFGNLKDMVTKGPTAMVNERMKEILAMADELNKIDRSDPEAMKAYTARQNAAIQDQLNSHFMTRNVISPENQAHIEQLQNQAIQNQAEFYQAWKEQRDRKAAEAGAGAPLPSPEHDV